MAEEKKVTKKLENLVTGVIIGGAIGSVLGLTLAPRKGSETRQIIKDKSQELLEKGKEVSGEFIDEHHEKIAAAKIQLKKSKKGLLRWIVGLIKSRSKK